MIRKRNFLIITVIIFVTFLFTTNYLLVLLNTPESEVRVWSIEEQILLQLKNLPEYYHKNTRNIDNRTQLFIKNINLKNVVKIPNSSLKNLWDDFGSKISKEQLYDLTDNNLGTVLYALQTAGIKKADIDTRGTQLKLLLTLEGDQQAVFKPKWYDKEKIIEGPVYAGKDRYGAEIVAFYLSAILNKPLTPVSTDRTLSLKRDILPVSTKLLLNTSFEKNNRTCIYGKCFYCKKEDPICENEHFLLTGAVIFNIKETFKSYRSPWQRTYHKNKKAAWQETNNYCKFVKEKLSKKRIYDLIDTAIFDFLLQNGDRHHYETFEDNVIWIDNGKGLGNPNIHHLDILAPLYQCCILRRKTLENLLNLTGGALRTKLENMPNMSNLISEAHLKSFEQRLLLIFATIEYCKNVKNV